MILFTLFSLFMDFTPPAQAKEGFHICYFSLNNEKEFKEMEKFTDKLNRFSKYKITVSEHLTEDNRNPEEAFEQMVQSTHCDGLVISGHHTGAFGGSRADGSLRIDFLEKLSCQKEYEKWFHSIHSLWLQGCRTLGVGKIESLLDEIPAYDPDYHTQRVGQALEEDHLEQGLADLNMEFSATLDQDNPLSSRYLRTFSKAKVFGWTKTAPGIKAKSEYSIPFHIAHISKLLEEEESKDIEEIGNPLSNQFEKAQVQSYLNALELLLNDLRDSDKHCEDLLVEGWLKHGRAHGKAEPFSFDNPDLQAFPKLIHSDGDFQNDVKAKECALKRAKDRQEILAAIDALTTNQKLIHYGFNSIWETLLQNDDKELQIAIRHRLKNNPNVLEFIQKKIESKQLGILRKIDYYGFYRDLFDKNNGKVEEKLSAAILKMLAEDVSDDNYAGLDYRQTLIYSAVKNRIFSPEGLNELIDLKGIRPSELSSIADALGQLAKIGNTTYGSEQFDRLIQAKNSDYATLGNVAGAIGSSEREIKNADLLFEKILHSKKSEMDVMYSLVYAIKDYKFPLKNSDRILKEIARSSFTQEGTLSAIVVALNASRLPAGKKESIIDAVFSSESISSKVIKELALAVAKSEKPYPNADKYFEKFFRYAQETESPFEQSDTAGGLAIALMEQKSPVKNTEKLLQKIFDTGFLGYHEEIALAKAILTSEKIFSKRKELFEKLLRSKKIEEIGYNSLIDEILSENVPKQNKAMALKKILDRPSVENYHYAMTARALIDVPPFPGRDEMIMDIIERRITGSYWLEEVFSTLLGDKSELKDLQKLQSLIIDSPKMDISALNNLKIRITEKKLGEAETNRLLGLVEKSITNKQK